MRKYEHNDIPAELRWEIAARSDSVMPFAREMII